ncbi:MAG: DUF2339 domain-containing protein [Flavobacteriaceae bacterium]
MENNEQKLEELIKRLEELSRKQKIFSEEIQTLRSEIQFLKSGQFTDETEIKSQFITQASQSKAPIQTSTIPKSVVVKKPKQPSDLEKIIGESWLNKIGILGIIIGVTILGKYSIDNNLISPLTRIILGYLVGIGLLGFGIKLKEKFENYSAVLVSGAMAIHFHTILFSFQ